MNVTHYIGFDVHKKKRQLLREDRRRADYRRRPAASYAPGAAPMGAATHRTVARRHGGDAVQRLDLRCVEAICGRVADGAPGHMKAIGASKKKNDRLDARKTA